MTDALVAIMLGAAAGVLSAMFGVGGGLIFVPTLIFLGKSTHVAVATSLAAMVPVILMGSWRQTRYGSVRWPEAIVVGIASVPTAKLGEVVASSLSNARPAAPLRAPPSGDRGADGGARPARPWRDPA